MDDAGQPAPVRARRAKCRPSQHDDRLMRGGRVKCRKCGDVFPCRDACEHVDCAAATGRALPDWITTNTNGDAP